MAIPQSNLLVTCSADKTVREFDLRVPVSLLANHQRHRHVVVGVACSESYVYSGGEDKSDGLGLQTTPSTADCQGMFSLSAGYDCQC